MAWLDSVKARKEAAEAKRPERFRNKTDDQILKELEEAESYKKRFEDGEASRASEAQKVTSLETQVAEVRAKLAEAEANRRPATAAQPEELANFVEDPDRAFAQRVAPLTAATLLNSALSSRMLAQQLLDNNDVASGNKSMDGRLFRVWSNEIDSESKKYQTAQLTSPQAWIGIFYYLKGLHSEELANPDVRKKKYNFVEPSTTQAPPPDAKPKDAKEVLNDQEKHVADKMGVSYENYLKRKKEMTFINA